MLAEGCRYIEEVVAKSKHQTLCFHVSVYCGTSHDIALEEANEGDKLIQSDGVMIAINLQVRPLLEGVSLHAKE